MASLPLLAEPDSPYSAVDLTSLQFEEDSRMVQVCISGMLRTLARRGRIRQNLGVDLGQGVYDIHGLRHIVRCHADDVITLRARNHLLCRLSCRKVGLKALRKPSPSCRGAT